MLRIFRDYIIPLVQGDNGSIIALGMTIARGAFRHKYHILFVTSTIKMQYNRISKCFSKPLERLFVPSYNVSDESVLC